MKKSPDKKSSLYFPWDKAACDKENQIIKEDPGYYPDNAFNYFEFLRQFPPNPEELKKVVIYNEPFTLL